MKELCFCSKIWHGSIALVLMIAVSGANSASAQESGASSASAQESGAAVSLQHCIDVALENNVDLQIAQEAVEESSALRASALGNFGPKVKVEGNVMRWDKATEVSFFESDGGGGTLPPPATPYEMVLAQMLTSFGEPLTVREQVTKSFSVVVAQPISQLYAIYLMYSLQDEGHEANQIKHQLSRRVTVYKVTEAYLRVLQVKRYVTIATAGVETVEAHLAQAKKFADAGLIGRNDLLKAELGLANAKGGLIQARAGHSLALAALSNLLGEGIPEDATFEDPFGDDIPEYSRPLGECQDQALDTRLELRELEKRIEQARTGKALAWSQFIPSVTAIGNYTHMEGSKFQDEDAFFIGGMLSWDVWEWGSKYFQVDAAASKLKQAELGRRKVRELLALEVEKNYLDMHTARQSITIAEASIAVAEENLHIEESRYEVQASTSTDVLDAQTARQRALVGHATAFYNYLVAFENLKKSIGEDPLSD